MAIGVKRFCLVDRSGTIVEGPCPKSTDFMCDWSPDRELVVVYSTDLRVGKHIEIVAGEEYCKPVEQVLVEIKR